MSERARILVVDDDPRIAASLRRALAYERRHVEVAEDGRMALITAREMLPDPIVLDVMLPALDDIEVYRRPGSASDVPILMLIARGAVGDSVVGWTAVRRTISSSPLPTMSSSRAYARCVAAVVLVGPRSSAAPTWSWMSVPMRCAATLDPSA